jgi:hypothetical protein
MNRIISFCIEDEDSVRERILSNPAKVQYQDIRIDGLGTLDSVSFYNSAPFEPTLVYVSRQQLQNLLEGAALKEATKGTPPSV